MKQIIYSLILVFIMILSCSPKIKNNGINIVPLNALNKTDTFSANNQMSIDRIEYFLVESISIDTARLYQVISQFVNHYKFAPESFSVYEMVFVRSYPDMTLEGINEESRTFTSRLNSERDPTIINYMWIQGRYAGAIKFINGKAVSHRSSNIKSISIDSSAQ